MLDKLLVLLDRKANKGLLEKLDLLEKLEQLGLLGLLDLLEKLDWHLHV
jgi:hypothetical protein